MSAFTYAAKRGFDVTGNDTGAWMADSTAETIGVDETTDYVTNGTFDTDTVWTKGTGWTIGSGVASKAAGTASGLSQDFTGVLTHGKMYRVIFTLSNYTAGIARFYISANPHQDGHDCTANGTYTEYFKYDSSYPNIGIYGDASFAGDIDNVIITETGQLIENGTFTDNFGWTAYRGATLSVVSNQLNVQSSPTNFASSASQQIDTVAGETYILTVDVTYVQVGGAARLSIGSVTGDLSNAGSSDIYNDSDVPVGSHTITFIAVDSDTWIILSSHLPGSYDVRFDNVSVRLAIPDLSTAGNGLEVHGQISKVPVAIGSETVMYSGFSANNYLHLPEGLLEYTGDFYYSMWVDSVDEDKEIFTHGDISGFGPSNTIHVWPYANIFKARIGGVGHETGAILPLDGTLYNAVIVRSGATLYTYINGTLQKITTGNTNTITGPIYVGKGFYAKFVENIALFKTEAYAPSAAKIKQWYESEKHLFKDYNIFTQVGEEYSIDVNMTRIDYERNAVRHVNRSLSGQTETLLDRRDQSYNLTTTLIQKNSLSAIQEMLYAAETGASFTFDPYGTTAIPDNPLIVEMDGNYSMQRAGQIDYFNVSFKVREAS